MNSARAVRMRRRRTTMIVVTAMIRNVSSDTLQTLAVAEGDQSLCCCRSTTTSPIVRRGLAAGRTLGAGQVDSFAVDKGEVGGAGTVAIFGLRPTGAFCDDAVQP